MTDAVGTHSYTGPTSTHEIYNIVDEYDASLTTPTTPWDFARPAGDLKHITTSLIATMLNSYGIGLSANQCRLPYRIFVMGAMGENQQFIEAVVNPEILEHRDEDLDSEGCLSYPGVYLNIKRAAAISVRYYTIDGREQTKVFAGLTARVFQHEYDHLDGIRFTTYVKAFEYQRAKAKAKGNIRKQKKIVQRALRELKKTQTVKKTVEQATMLTYSTDNGPVLTIDTGTEKSCPNCHKPVANPIQKMSGTICEFCSHVLPWEWFNLPSSNTIINV